MTDAYYRGAFWGLVVFVLLATGKVVADMSTASITEILVSPQSGRLLERQYRCDNSNAISGTGPNGGEVCATGMHWKAVDARGALFVSLVVNEYGTGSGNWSLWNCQDPAGRGALTGVDIPGTEDPLNTPTPAEPDPLCAQINLDLEGNPMPVTGTGLKEVHWHSRNYDYLVVRVDDCSGNCDASIELQVRW